MACLRLTVHHHKTSHNYKIFLGSFLGLGGAFLECFWGVLGFFWGVLGSYGRFWEVMGCSGIFWGVPSFLGVFWEDSWFFFWRHFWVYLVCCFFTHCQTNAKTCLINATRNPQNHCILISWLNFLILRLKILIWRLNSLYCDFFFNRRAQEMPNKCQRNAIRNIQKHLFLISRLNFLILRLNVLILRLNSLSCVLFFNRRAQEILKKC